MVTIKLNNFEVKRDAFIVNDGMNYGRFFGVDQDEYEFQILKAEVLKYIEKDYNIVRDEIKLDDENEKETSDFSNTNYCSLVKLFEYEFDFSKICKIYDLDRVLFGKIFTNSSKAIYIINSTDEIKIDDDFVVFKGKVFKRPIV